MNKKILILVFLTILFIMLNILFLNYYRYTKISKFIDKFDNTLLNVYNEDLSNTNLTLNKKIFLVKAYILQNKIKFLNKIHYDIENNQYMVYNDFIQVYNEIFKEDTLSNVNYYLNNIDFLKMYINSFRINNISKIDNNIYIVNTTYYNECNKFKVKYYLEYINNNVYLIKYLINT